MQTMQQCIHHTSPANVHRCPEFRGRTPVGLNHPHTLQRQLPHSGCRCTTHSIVHSNADKAVPTATRLPSVQHSSQIPMLQQYSRHSNLAVCGSTSGSLSGPRQAPHLGRSVRSSRRLCRRDYPSPAAVMACISSCAHHESTYIIKARPPPPAAAEAGALSIPWNSSLHSFGAPVNPSTARGYSVTTAAGGLSSLDTESTYSDDETTSGEQDSGGLPWYYDEMVIKDNWAATDEEVKFWTAIGEQMKRGTAMKAIQQLDPQWRYGVSYARLGGPITDDSKGRRPSETGTAPSGSLWFRRAKTKDPFAVVLVKVGAFYESAGYDAALMMEHGGFKAMGSDKKNNENEIPRAGCRQEQIQDVLKLLVEDAGLSVAVWEEEPDTKEHGVARKEQRPRRFAQLVTPENPSYLYGLSNSSQDRHADAPNIKGISLTSTGCSVFVLNRYSDVVSVYHNISIDSLWSLLISDGSRAPVVYMHWPLDQPKPKSSPTSSKLEQDFLKVQRRLKSLSKQLADGDARVSSYYSVDPLLGFKERVRDALKWPVDKEIRDLPAWDAQDYWPGVRPPYHSTLSQLGLVNTPGIPSLADNMLHRKAGKLVQGVIRSLLMNPPPHEVAAATRRALRQLASHHKLIMPPSYDVSGSTTPQKVQLILGAGEGNERFFQNLLGALYPVIGTLDGSHSAMAGLVDDMWHLLCHTMGCQQQDLSKEQVLQAAQQAAAAICKVVAGTGNPNKGSSSSSSGTDEDAPQQKLKAIPAVPGNSSAAVQQAVESFASRMEVYRKRVKPDIMQKECEQVDFDFCALITVLDGLVYTLTQQAEQAGLKLPSKDVPCVFPDDTNLSAWVKVPSSQLKQHMKDKQFLLSACGDLDVEPSARVYEALPEPQTLHHPYDRNGLSIKNKDVFSCNLLDKVLTDYRGAVAAANSAATVALKNLSQQLAPLELELSAAVQLGILLQALYEHSAKAGDAGWSIPAVGREEQLEAGVQFADDVDDQYGVLRLKSLQPYWMEKSTAKEPVSDSVVYNDVELDGFMLLTGPNMAGKSTVLRSTAAAALCGSVGLAIPAAAGSLLPQLDAIMLRTFTGDAPSEQLSAFGVEMNQMNCVLTDARPGSLVLIDELGKGTEVGSGTALASALLRELAERGARGIFATHLHALLDLTADTPRLTNHSMQVIEQQTAEGHTRLVSTWRLVPGPCTQSLALDVARNMGLPAEVLQLAQQEHQKIKQLGGYRALIKLAAGGQLAGASGLTDTTSAVADAASGTCRLSTAESDNDDSSSSSSNSILSKLGSRVRSRRRSGSTSNHASSSNEHTQSQQQRQQQQHISQVVTILSKLAHETQPTETSHQPEQPTLAAAAATSSDIVAAESPAVHHLYRQGAAGPGAATRKVGNQPPVAHLQAPVLYVAYFGKTGKWHAGQSMNLAERWKAHTYRLGKQRVDMWYVVLDTTDSSIQSQLEGQLHLALDAAGVPLDSKHDAHRARRS